MTYIADLLGLGLKVSTVVLGFFSPFVTLMMCATARFRVRSVRCR
jgi:hypothetical protein